MPPRRGARARLVLGITVVTGALAAAACSGDDHAPSSLLDGSPAPHLPVELEGLTARPVLTIAQVVPIGDVDPGSMSASCLQVHWGGVEPADRLVERTGVFNETVTFRDRSGRALYGCDNSAGPRERDRRWCGGAFGRLYSGRLRDPRLDLSGCSTGEEDPVGFVWVEPHRDAVYLVVEQPEYVEVYPVEGNIPVRVASTSDVDIQESRATFKLSEHDAEGRLLRRYQVDAAVAG